MNVFSPGYVSEGAGGEGLSEELAPNKDCSVFSLLVLYNLPVIVFIVVVVEELELELDSEKPPETRDAMNRQMQELKKSTS